MLCESCSQDSGDQHSSGVSRDKRNVSLIQSGGIESSSDLWNLDSSYSRGIVECAGLMFL